MELNYRRQRFLITLMLISIVLATGCAGAKVRPFFQGDASSKSIEENLPIEEEDTDGQVVDSGLGKTDVIKVVDSGLPPKKHDAGLASIDSGPSALDHNSIDTPMAITDGNSYGITSYVVLNQGGAKIKTMKISVDITHPDTKELFVRIECPTSHWQILFAGAKTGANLHQTFDVNACVGDAASGNFALRVFDLYPLNTGTLDHWGMALTTQ